MLLVCEDASWTGSLKVSTASTADVSVIFGVGVLSAVSTEDVSVTLGVCTVSNASIASGSSVCILEREGRFGMFLPLVLRRRFSIGVGMVHIPPF
jgi:hypothetical protein